MISDEDIDPNKITIREVKNSNPRDPVQRWEILYTNNEKQNNLFLYIKYKNDDAKSGIYTLGIRANNNGVINNNRKSLPLLLDHNDDNQIKFISALTIIYEKCKELGNNIEIKSPIKEYIVNGELKLSVWCKIIESKSGTVYTKIYDIYGNPVKIDEINNEMSVRPGITFSLIYTKTYGYTLHCNLSELCVIEKYSQNSKSILAPLKNANNNSKGVN
jgi:hypothetical protein